MKSLRDTLWSIVAPWTASDWTLLGGFVVTALLGLHFISADQASQLGSALAGLVQSVAGVVAGVILMTKILRFRQRAEMAAWAVGRAHTFGAGVVAGYVGPHEECDHGVTATASPAPVLDPGDCDPHRGA